jgi:SAM-dependent methyltransferase
MIKLLEPFTAVDILVRKYLAKEPSSSILDIGCEYGKNAIACLQAGHKVTLLDIEPDAVRESQENIQSLGLQNGIADSVICKIETLDLKYGPFKAVIGTYVFSFIPPELFDKVMKENVLGRVEQGGYFAGGFFGPTHAWSKNPMLTFVSSEKLETLFSSMGFIICEKEEEIHIRPTALGGWALFHTFTVVAKKIS